MTDIEWVRNPENITQGITVNSKTGCVNGCPYCYARKLAHGRLRGRYLGNANYSVHWSGDKLIARDDPFYPRWWPERLVQISKLKKPTGIFLDDMSDWMWEGWPEERTQMELQVMRDCPQHRFYTLTKQPQNLIKWSPFPENCWVGVTATNQDMFERGIYHLRQIKATVKFMSFEPLLGRIASINVGIRELNWPIIGAQTKPYKPPEIEWVREIVEAADKAGIPVFLKDNLKPLIKYPEHEWAWGKHPPGHIATYTGLLRQEMPIRA